MTIWILRAIVVLICITIHEFFHGYTAFKLGDDTAKRAGRLTLNPIKHIDPIGTLMLFIASFGWAKPVPVNPYNFNNMKTSMAITAAAGPISNFIFAILSALLLKLLVSINGIDVTKIMHSGTVTFDFWILSFLQLTIMINIALGLFNLLPLPPLDGSKILGGFMNDDMYFRWMEFEQKGAYLLIGILLISYIFNIPVISSLIMPPLQYFTSILMDFSLK